MRALQRFGQLAIVYYREHTQIHEVAPTDRQVRSAFLGHLSPKDQIHRLDGRGSIYPGASFGGKHPAFLNRANPSERFCVSGVQLKVMMNFITLFLWGSYELLI